MISVIVRFDLGDAFDPARLALIAEQAAPKFRAVPGLVSKTFTVDAVARQAVNVYFWESEAAARAFFTPEALAGVARVYGVAPTLQFGTVVARVAGPAAPAD